MLLPVFQQDLLVSLQPQHSVMVGGSEDKVLDLQQRWSSGPELVDYEVIYM